VDNFRLDRKIMTMIVSDATKEIDPDTIETGITHSKNDSFFAVVDMFMCSRIEIFTVSCLQFLQKIELRYCKK